MEKCNMPPDKQWSRGSSPADKQVRPSPKWTHGIVYEDVPGLELFYAKQMRRRLYVGDGVVYY